MENFIVITLSLVSVILSLIIGGTYFLEKTIMKGFKELRESAKTTEIEEWLQWWQAMGSKLWKEAQK